MDDRYGSNYGRQYCFFQYYSTYYTPARASWTIINQGAIATVGSIAVSGTVVRTTVRHAGDRGQTRSSYGQQSISVGWSRRSSTYHNPARAYSTYRCVRTVATGGSIAVSSTIVRTTVQHTDSGLLLPLLQYVPHPITYLQYIQMYSYDSDDRKSC